MHTTKSSGLLKDEQDLKKNFTNRAAACFPLFDLYKTDLKLVFQNYWKWKRGINILYNATIRNKNGVTLFNLGLTKPLNQNMLSCKKIINENNINYKEVKYGTIELEIISTKNIVYPFPAILAYYESISGFVSVVHSAGRTLEESTQNYENFNETNFYASSEKEYKPFIHIFNGPEGFLKDLQVNIRSFNHDFNSRKFELDFVIKPYQSKLLFLDKFIEIYKSELIKDNKFLSKEILRNIEFGISLSGSSKSIYPRFICGNYDLVNDHPYVTHTFRKILDEKDSVKVTNHHCSSTIALPRTADMNIKALIFPTTSPSRKELKASFYDLDKKEIFKQFDNVDISNDGNCFYIDDENYDDNIKNIGLEVSPSLNSTNYEIPAKPEQYTILILFIFSFLNPPRAITFF